ncbi:C39 family peptidase [uncultured Pseudonocardia sp.]|uniref:C39 family peptidase n=1 Tax=uncultured Pseudonocardia sp. TaxID=211455 RepID=UPI00260FFCB9|nr:C39 family peptidase [uncultured Pseudonocardia sp.]
MSPEDVDLHTELDVADDLDDVHGEDPLVHDLDDTDAELGAGMAGPFADAPHTVGDSDALGYWHMQEQPNSCAVASQEFIIDEFTGVDHTEAEMRDVAAQHGWFTPDGGTPMEDTGQLLAYYGIPTEQVHGASLDQLEAALINGDGVIVGLDSGEIWNPGFDNDDALTEYLGIPGQGADHAVQVVGVDHTDPANPQVILNDPGSPTGQGERVSLATFLDAWEDSGNFMVTAHRP